MDRSRIAKISAVALGIVGTAVLATAPAQATEGGPLCHVNVNTQVYSTPGSGGYLYTISAGGGFRLHGYTSNGYAYGHGAGHGDGYIRNDGRIYC